MAVIASGHRASCVTVSIAPRYVWLFSRVEVPSRSAVAARLIPSHQFIHLRLFAFSECPSTAGMRISVSSLAF